MIAEKIRSHGHEPRPSEPELKERIKNGKSPYQVIGKLLILDFHILADHFQRFHLSETKKIDPLDESLIHLYKLGPNIDTEFLTGFSWISKEYSTLEKASRPDGKPQKILQWFNKQLKAEVKEAKEGLASDPSGIAWLTKKAEEAFPEKEHKRELEGAKTAILGAQKLFELLSPATMQGKT